MSISIANYIDEKCDVIRIDGDEYFMPCPECGSSESFSFNIEKKLGQCWRTKNCTPFVCNDITLVAALEGISNKNAMKLLGYKEGEVKRSVLDALKLHMKRQRSERRTVIEEDDPKRYNNIMMPYNYIKIIDNSLIPNFLVRRGYALRTLKHFKLGVCRYGKYFDRIIIPISTQDSTAFQARRMHDPGNKGYAKRVRKDIRYKQKYLNATNSKRDFLIYNYNQRYRKPYVIVVESVTSVWRLYEYGYQAVAILGCSTLSPYQIDLLSQLPIDFIGFCLDRDAIKKAKEQVRDLSITMDTRFIKLPDERDPDDLTKKQVQKYIERKLQKYKFGELRRRVLTLL